MAYPGVLSYGAVRRALSEDRDLRKSEFALGSRARTIYNRAVNSSVCSTTTL